MDSVGVQSEANNLRRTEIISQVARQGDACVWCNRTIIKVDSPRVNKLLEEDAEYFNCAICYTSFFEKTEQGKERSVVILNCGHPYCRLCIDKMIEHGFPSLVEKDLCPLKCYNKSNSSDSVIGYQYSSMSSYLLLGFECENSECIQGRQNESGKTAIKFTDIKPSIKLSFLKSLLKLSFLKKLLVLIILSPVIVAMSIFVSLIAALLLFIYILLLATRSILQL